MKAWQLSDQLEGGTRGALCFINGVSTYVYFKQNCWCHIIFQYFLFIAKPFSFGRSVCWYCIVVWSSDGGASMCHALPGVRRILGATLDTETAGSAFTHYLGLGSALALAVCKPNPHHQLMTQCSQNEVNAVRWAETLLLTKLFGCFKKGTIDLIQSRLTFGFVC